MQQGIDMKKIEELASINESIHRLIQCYMSKNLSQSLSLAQMYLLHLLLEKGTCTPSSIAQMMGVTSGAITSLADRLHKQGLITRERSENDRRVVMISLTTSGQELAKKLDRERIELLATIFNKLPEEDIDHLLKVFYKLHEAVTSLNNTN